MKKLKSMLYGAYIMLACIATTPAWSGSADFAGPFISIQGASAGVALDGRHTSEDGEHTEGTAGKVVPLAGAEIGYNIPITDSLFISVGYMENFGRAEISRGDEAADKADTKFHITGHHNIYIAPQISFGDTSAAFVKLGYSEADLKVSCNNACGDPGNLQGGTISVGTQTLFPWGVYVKTEAGVSVYDQINMSNVGGSANAKLGAKPRMAYGAVSIGYKF